MMRAIAIGVLAVGLLSFSGCATARWTSVAAPAQLNAPGAQWIVVLHGASGLQATHLELAQEIARAGFVAVAGCWQFIASPPAAAPNPVCAEATPQATW